LHLTEKQKQTNSLTESDAICQITANAKASFPILNYLVVSLFIPIVGYNDATDMSILANARWAGPFFVVGWAG
jgi:hypothetical protein